MTYIDIENNYRFKEAFYGSHTPMCFIDLQNGRIMDANLAACDYYGYSNKEFLSMNIREINVLSKEEIKREIFKAKKENRKFLRLIHKLNNNKIRKVKVYSTIIKSKNKKICFAIIHDLNEGNEKLDILNDTYDLHSRNHVVDILNDEINKIYPKDVEQEKIAVLFLKINQFKSISNAFGYIIADKVIKKFHKILKEDIQGNHIVKRFNEDEFVILVPQTTDLNSIGKDILKINEILNRSIKVYDNEFQITTNIGISVYPDDGKDGLSLVRRANIAMNKSQELNISNALRFDESLDREVKSIFWIKNDLISAISKDELILNYQPIYDVIRKRLIGAEALVRWKHKEKGIIPPLEFIPIAEETGLIHSIGKWVLFNACKQNKRWQDLGYEPIYISVNVSALQMEEPGFIQFVKQTLKESRLEPKYLQLEITETVSSKDYRVIEKTVKELTSLGISFAIDDFGTGYSSLEELHNLNINNIKMDKMFIDNLEHKGKEEIAKTIISLAEGLSVNLIAEGVETKEQLEFLVKNKCTIAQGYLFSRPVETYKIEELLKKTRNNHKDL